MKHKRLSSVLSLVIAVAVFFTFQFAFVQEASAASKTKTVYQITSVKYSTTYSDGEKISGKSTFSYDKNGLCNKVVDDDVKVVYTRTKKGLVKEIKTYNNKGKVIQTRINTIKNGKISKSKLYDGKYTKNKKPIYIYTYTYNSNGDPTKIVYEDKANKTKSTEMLKYYSKGKLKQTTYTESGSKDVTKYDKKGHVTYSSYTNGGEKDEATYTYKFDKKGNVKEQKCKDTSTFNGETYKSSQKTTYKNKYDKAGNLISVKENTYDSDGKKISSSSTQYTYKKFKIAKKYVKYL